MKSKIIIIAVLLFSAISCKKKGCTDPLATNYNSEATKDDGSCSYPTSAELLIGTWEIDSTVTYFDGLYQTTDYPDGTGYTKRQWDGVNLTAIHVSGQTALNADVGTYVVNGNIITYTPAQPYPTEIVSINATNLHLNTETFVGINNTSYEHVYYHKL
jgi:hypothetical protein